MTANKTSWEAGRSAAPTAIWEVRLLGGLSAAHGNASLVKFPSRPVAMLLARLALYPGRSHSREELIELLWPGVDLEVGRGRLRQTLSTLRRLLEPRDVGPGSVLRADRLAVGVQPSAVWSDVEDFERHLREKSFAKALQSYRGDLLPGFFDEWVEEERTRLRALYEVTRARDDDDEGEAPKPAPFPSSGGVAPALPAMLATLAAPVRSLPAYVSVFFGREKEQQSAQRMLAQHRLVTLHGFGGCGKTRLAVEVARTVAGFDTVAFVPLGECNDANQIAEQIRSALRMQAVTEDASGQLCAFLADRDVLLVLDNFEQLVDSGGAAVVQELLERLPRLRCLVTSRRSLDIAGEREISVGALPLPHASMGSADVERSASVALFVDRARGARPDFALTERNRAALIELTQALEGLPLAIEIAASRIRAFSPQEMCAALQQRFSLLTRQGPRAARHGRHASLQMAVEWSWLLLNAEQQAFFAALSVFRGGSTATAVDAVYATHATAAQLEQLVTDSLLRAETDAAGITRFSMLESIREFAQEKLGAAALELRARHRAHFLQVALEASAGHLVEEEDLPNQQQAIRSAIEDDEPAAALQAGVALRPYWDALGMPPTVLRLLREALVRCSPDAAALQAALNLLAEMALRAGDTDAARDDAARALKAAGVEPAGRAAALVTLAHVEWQREQRVETVGPMLDEALALAQAASLTRVQADAMRMMATVVLQHGSRNADYKKADAMFASAESLYRDAGESSWAHRALLSRVGCLAGLERYVEARQILATCEQFFTSRASTADLIAVANLTGFLESAQAHWHAATAAGQRGVQLAWDRHAHLALAAALWNLPHPLAMVGDFARAARLMAFSAGFWERNVGPLSANDVSTLDEVRALVVERMGADQAMKEWNAGANLSLSEAVRLALTTAA
jgi:predicted ATPase